MPVYEYEGKFYELPTGVSNEEAIARIRSYLGTAQTPETPAEPPPQRSLGEEGLRQLGLTARAGVQAFTAPATAVLEAGRGAFNLASQALGSERRLPSFYQEQAKGLSAIGLPEPETALERAVGSGTEAMAGTGAIARMLPNVPAMAANLQRQVPAAGAAGLAAQPTAEAVKGYTGSDLAATIAAVGVGAITAAGAGRTISAIEQRKIPLQTAEEVRARASRAYTSVDNAGITLKDSSVRRMVGDVRSDLDNANMIPGSPEADYINASLARIESIIEQNPQMSFSTLDKVRGILNDLKTNKDPNIRRLGGVATTRADDFITGLTTKDVIAGQGGIDKAVKTIVEARKDWRNASRAQVLDDALNVAEAKNLDPKASESELIRRGFINIAASKEKMKLFTNEEKNIIRSVAEGGPLDPLLTFASQFSPLRSKLAAAGGAFAATQAPVTTGVVAGGGLLADYAQSVMRRRAAQQAINRIASGETTPSPESLAYRGLLSTALNPPLE
jgi:hypothetical protein